MRVLELKQGHAKPRIYHGVRIEDALVDLRAWDAQFLALFGSVATAREPTSWAVKDVADHAPVPWGHEWYRVQDDGTLQFHSGDYDSSG